jgi:SagB-type dehydrogenase family enzyme
MLKKILGVLLVVTGIIVYQVIGRAENPKPDKQEGMKEMKLNIIKLNEPDLKKGLPLMQALKKRKSDRNFSDKALTLQQLSELLWSANGINRKDGMRTAPSAMNVHPVDVYAVLSEGIYRYEPDKHQLVPVAQGDFRKTAGSQDFVAVAPLNLVYVADLSRFNDPKRSMPDEGKINWSYAETGFQAENVYLYCASEGLGSVVRAFIDKEKFGKAINIQPNQTIILAQTIGYLKD